MDPNFVYLDESCPTIIQSVRYFTGDNFIGRKIEGYNCNRIIVSKQGAEALAAAHAAFLEKGFSLVVYDAYRPQKAVNEFVRWSRDDNDQINKDWYYPNIDKSRVFELGYIAERSGHSRGSAIDLTLIEIGKSIISPPVPSIRSFEVEGSTMSFFPFLDDNTVDMGTSFDLLDTASHYSCPFIPPQAQIMRTLLREIMINCGFQPYEEEWWHFSLCQEPFPETYFDFNIE
jgi:zinc D-Ala-D-Ala dipeptidase